MEERHPPIRPGRPRIEVYRNRTKQWISRDTFKRRYFEAKGRKSPLEQLLEELKWKLEI